MAFLHLPLFIADNLALDFINTAYGTGDAQVDVLTSNERMQDWMQRAGIWPEDLHAVPDDLLVVARAFRDEMRLLVFAAKQGKAAETFLLNQLLETGRPVCQLAWNVSESCFHIQRTRRDDSAASLLYPVAQSLAHLLTEVPLAWVRQCAAEDCSLLFHDVTKSHRRRWCSMAACGNRMKVAAFRSRQKG